MVEHVRTIEPGFHWIQESGRDRSHFVESQRDALPEWYDPEDTLHIAQNAYLFEDERSLLFDTLSPASQPEILDALTDRLVGGLDYLVVSHPDIPHAGNAMRILEEYPEADLIAPRPGNGHALYHLEDARKVGPGDSIDLGRFTLRFHEATFPDAPIHVWMSEQTTGTLFTVDWLGYPHHGQESLHFPDEFATPLTLDRLVQFHGRVLFWLQYVDPDVVAATIDSLIAQHEPELVAPGHGNPIREDPIDVMKLAKPVVERVVTAGRVGTLG